MPIDPIEKALLMRSWVLDRVIEEVQAIKERGATELLGYDPSETARSAHDHYVKDLDDLIACCNLWKSGCRCTRPLLGYRVYMADDGITEDSRVRRCRVCNVTETGEKG